MIELSILIIVLVELVLLSLFYYIRKTSKTLENIDDSLKIGLGTRMTNFYRNMMKTRNRAMMIHGLEGLILSAVLVILTFLLIEPEMSGITFQILWILPIAIFLGVLDGFTYEKLGIK